MILGSADTAGTSGYRRTQVGRRRSPRIGLDKFSHVLAVIWLRTNLRERNRWRVPVYRVWSSGGFRVSSLKFGVLHWSLSLELRLWRLMPRNVVPPAALGMHVACACGTQRLHHVVVHQFTPPYICCQTNQTRAAARVSQRPTLVDSRLLPLTPLVSPPALLQRGPDDSPRCGSPWDLGEKGELIKPDPGERLAEDPKRINPRCQTQPVRTDSRGAKLMHVVLCDLSRPA